VGLTAKRIILTILIFGWTIAVIVAARSQGDREGYERGLKAGKLDAYHSMSMDSTMYYLYCLRGSCDSERLVSEYFRERAREHIRGVKEGSE